ncbi:MAG TPA: hypothetical protein ENN72_09330 [Firmicutes bacterium]|nr:hypothetical protein [Bacillota bacterium]
MKAESALVRYPIPQESGQVKFSAYERKFSAVLHENRLQLYMSSGRKKELQSDIILSEKTLSTGVEIALSPSLPDKPFSLNTSHPIHVLPWSTVSFFIPIPLWAVLSVNNIPVKDIILHDFSKTWIGETGQKGDLGYTLCTDPLSDDRKLLPDAAYTEIIIENKSKVFFSIARLIIYTPFKSLYKSEGGYLYTDRQRLLINPNNKQEIKLLRPSVAVAQIVARPRKKATKDYFSRFAGFFKKVTVMS